MISTFSNYHSQNLSPCLESLPGFAIAQNLEDIIKKRATPDMILDVLRGTPNPKDVDGMEGTIGC